jgi:hypothetical protein
MNRKLGHLIKAAIFALPLALPGVALAQSADTTANNPPVQDDANKGSLNQDNSVGNSNAQGSSGMNSGGTLDQTDKQNAGSLGTTPSDTPPAGKLDTSGSSTSGDRSVGGDINKPNDTTNMNSDTSTTTTHKKKSVKKSTTTDLNNDHSNDINR